MAAEFCVISKTVRELRNGWRSNWVYAFIFNWPIKCTLHSDQMHQDFNFMNIQPAHLFSDHSANIEILWKGTVWSFSHLPECHLTVHHQRASKEFVWFNGCVKEYVLLVFLMSLFCTYRYLCEAMRSVCVCNKVSGVKLNPESTASCLLIYLSQTWSYV